MSPHCHLLLLPTEQNMCKRLMIQDTILFSRKELFNFLKVNVATCPQKLEQSVLRAIKHYLFDYTYAIRDSIHCKRW